MHGADEIIPRMQRGEFADPFLLAGQIIPFERELDGEPGKILLRLTDFRDVFREADAVHAPEVEIVLAHGRMVGEANFREAHGDGARGVFGRLTRCVMSQRGVHVVVSRP